MPELTTSMTGTIALRPAATKDEAFLRLVYASSREEELDRVAWAQGQREAFLRQQFDAQDADYRRNYPGAEFLVIERDGEPVGRIYIHRTSGQIAILDIALIAGARGAGTGTYLMSELIDEGQRAGLPVTIYVEKWNRARRLYDRLGFQQAADTGVYLRMIRKPGARA
jgi:GNAT superfamily N-acetyltransferase